MKKLLIVLSLLCATVITNAQSIDTVVVESLSKMDTAVIVNKMISNSGIDIPDLDIKLETQNMHTVKVTGIFYHLEYGEEWIYTIGYITETK